MTSEEFQPDCRVGSVFIATVVKRRGHTQAIHVVNACALADKSTGSRLRTLRKLRGLSRGELADNAGLHVEKIRMAETCPRDVPIGVLAQICNSLKCNLGDLAEDVLVQY